MNRDKKVLLLIGSPKGEKSTSISLGNYLISKLEESGMTSVTIFIHRLVNREEKRLNLLSMIDNADLIILSFPLYVDSLPAPVIKAMEFIKEEKGKLESTKSREFITIVNSGFPEASQSIVALKICRVFAQDCGFTWKGGVAIGGGAAINGIPLQERGGMVRNVIKGLEITAQALIESREIPHEAIDLISKQFIPSTLYIKFGNLGWRAQARRHGAGKKLKDKPYSL